jgi:hypothetical protein
MVGREGSAAEVQVSQLSRSEESRMAINPPRIPLRIKSSDPYVVRQVVRTSRNRLLGSVMTLVAVLFVSSVGGWKVWYNLFAGPFRIEPASLTPISDSDKTSRYFVEFHADSITMTTRKEIRCRWWAYAVAPLAIYDDDSLREMLPKILLPLVLPVARFDRRIGVSATLHSALVPIMASCS